MSTKTITSLVCAATVFGPIVMVAPAAHADARFSCHFAGDNQAYTCALPVTSVADQVTTYTLKVPVNAGVSVQTGSVPMTDADNQPSGVMTVTETASGLYEVKLAFSDAYLATHPNDLQVYASFAGRIDTYSVKGPWTFDVNGVTSTLVSPDGVYCDTECREKPLPDGAHKATWNNGNGTIGANVWAGPDLVGQGQDITLSDSVGAGQTDCNASLSTVNKGVYTKVQDVAFNGSTATITWKWRQQPDGTALVLGVTCKVPGPGVYTDTGYVNGTELQRSVQVLSAGAGGEGTAPKPVYPIKKVTVIPGTPAVTKEIKHDAIYKVVTSDPVVGSFQVDRQLPFHKAGTWAANKYYEKNTPLTMSERKLAVREDDDNILKQRENGTKLFGTQDSVFVKNLHLSDVKRAGSLEKALERRTGWDISLNVKRFGKGYAKAWLMPKDATDRNPFGKSRKQSDIDKVKLPTPITTKKLVKDGWTQVVTVTPAKPERVYTEYICPNGAKVATADTQCKS